MSQKIGIHMQEMVLWTKVLEVIYGCVTRQKGEREMKYFRVGTVLGLRILGEHHPKFDSNQFDT